MLYFSKLRIFFVSLISLFFILITCSNIIKFDNEIFNKSLLNFKRLEEANKIKNKDINVIKIIFNYEKYNTLSK